MAAQMFRKKPVEIEAMQFVITGDSDADMALVDSIMRWAISHATDPSISGSLAGDDPHMLISTLEGEMKASPGDWIIRGVQGEFYPCRSDIFEATYERVSDDPVLEVRGDEAP